MAVKGALTSDDCSLISRAAIFIDKDGTLIDDVPYNVAPEKIRLSKHAGTALRLLRKQGYALFLVSNQSGIALGLFDEWALRIVREKIDALLHAEDVWLDGFYYCPHWHDGAIARYAFDCNCRKPAPGMLTLAARQHGLSLNQSWMVGDILDDVEAGRRAGCGTVLIDNGNETQWRHNRLRQPDLRCTDLLQAAYAIANQSR